MAAKASDKPEEEVEGEEGAEKGASKPKLPLKLIAMIAGGVVLAGALGTGGYPLFGGSHETRAPAPGGEPAGFGDPPRGRGNPSETRGRPPPRPKVKMRV